MVWRSEGAQTLRTVWFGDLEARKPYAQYGLAISRRPNLMHSMVWRFKGSLAALAAPAAPAAGRGAPNDSVDT